ncbi:C40 family peptidase [Aquirufa sp. HETE-83D]|uniref:C40 family peptidase n=1 Tax=Aquirufa esocilacus TaxID=3096513 RepID=A0ABW6DGI4_9BACT
MYKRILLFGVLLLLLDSCSFVKRIFHRSPSTFYSHAEIKSIIKDAQNLKGVPYKFGGMDKKGMDCSGLLYTVYLKNEVNIPRVSADQANFGEEISINELKIGDWVFFATGKVGLISHVGLVTKDHPDITFIHASTTYGVREDKLNQKYWLNRIVKIIRPFKN